MTSENMSASAFLVNALGMEEDKGDQAGHCILCGTKTNTGWTIKDGFSSILGTSFTDWSRAAIRDVNGIVCGACSMLSASHPKKIVKLYRSRLRRCLIKQDGEVLMVGTNKRLKWILHNLPDQPFLLLDSRRLASKFIHHIWLSKVSLDKRIFYYCDDTGSHLVHLRQVIESGGRNKTATEHRLSMIYHDENTKAEQPLHPDHKHYNQQ